MYFATSRAPKKTSAVLVNFLQGRRETLKEYLARFNMFALEIRDLNEGIAVHQLMAGLRTGHFSLSLARKPAASLADLLTRSKKYINAEEVELARRQLDRNQTKQPYGRERREQPTFASRGKYNTYEWLRASLSEIIKDVQVAELIQFPASKKRKFPPANKSKYCKFHRDYGHDTNDCVTLKDKIETLIRKGRLTKYRQYGERR